jgi:hypothetical protein
LAEWFPQHGKIGRIPRLDFDWTKAAPVRGGHAVSGARSPVRLRREAAFLTWGTIDHPLELAVKVEPVGRHTPKAGAMTITAAAGKTTRLRPKSDDKQFVYTFEPPHTGPYLLRWQGDSKSTIRSLRCSAPLAALGESRGLAIFRWTGTLYFPVPVGVTRFALQIAGAGTAETVQATVRDAADRVVAQQDNIAPPHVFVLQRENAASAEVWSVTLDRAGEGVLEDVSVQTLGVPAVFAGSADDVFSVPAAE